ncbi:MAG: hypothetical protein ACOYL6_01195 [Bacteriovoracaceae bacterium]
MNEIFTKQFRRYLFYYFVYGLIFFLFNMGTVSVVSSFHFMLEHKIGTIEDWIFRHSWEITIVAKFLAFFTTIRIVNYLFHAGNPLVDYFRHFKEKPRSTILVLIISFYVVMLVPVHIHTSPTINENTNHQIVSFWGTFFFYFIDFLLISYLRFLYPLERDGADPVRVWRELVFDLVFPVLFYFFTIISTDYDPRISALMFFYMFLIYLIDSWLARGWINVALFVFLFIAPMGSLMGLDLFWGKEYSPFYITHGQPILSTLVLTLITCFYLFQKRSRLV